MLVFPTYDPELHGIDYARWQGTIDFDQVLEFGMLRLLIVQMGWAAEGRDAGQMLLDPYYIRNIAEMRKRAKNWLIMHYIVLVNRPWTIQLDNILRTAGELPKGEGLMFDIEYQHVLTMGWDAVNALMTEAEQRTQRPVAHYGGRFFPTYADSWILRVPSRPKLFAAYSGRESFQRYSADVQNVAGWQWGGGNNGAFIPGIWGGQARVDSIEVQNWSALNRVCGYDGTDLSDSVLEVAAA